MNQTDGPQWAESILIENSSNDYFFFCFSSKYDLPYLLFYLHLTAGTHAVMDGREERVWLDVMFS